MNRIELFYATNRKHEGDSRWKPTGYGRKFSDDGMENLRFGRAYIPYDKAEVQKHLGKQVGPATGDGEGLANYLTAQAKKATVLAYREKIDATVADTKQPGAVFGSQAMFADLHTAMRDGADALVYIHGFNVSWHEAVGSAAALQVHLNAIKSAAADARSLRVILFTWPSDGLALPFVSYKSDRTEAQGSGMAVGRAFLKLRDFLTTIRRDTSQICHGKIHLLCHSMGNFVLQSALERLRAFTPGTTLPRIFERIFLCAADVDDSVLELGSVMGDLHELGKGVSVYFNRGDVAMYVSDYTKGNPERLGTNGMARPSAVHMKVEQVDCTPVASGLVEHSYYLSGVPALDIRLSSLGFSPQHATRRRQPSSPDGRSWVLG